MTYYTKKAMKSRESLIKQWLRDYLGEIGDLAAEEKINLRAWVADGNSPYENPFYYYKDNGYPMDYINAVRVCEKLYQE